MTKFTVALLQITSYKKNQEANLHKGDVFCRHAATMGADIALFPEMWNNGYALQDSENTANKEIWQNQAISHDHPFFNHFVHLASELKIAIALTYLEKWGDGFRNSVSVIDRTGNVLLTYAKVHTCEFDQEAFLTPGEDFYVCEMDTGHGKVKLGAMICFDREFPESARILMLKGAEIILTPNACELEENRLTQFRTRAYENMVGVAMTNYATPQENGHSVAFDGIAFDRKGARNHLIVEAGEAEGIYLANFDLSAMRAYRKREVWGNSYRRPGRYLELVSGDVKPPFKRRDSTR